MVVASSILLILASAVTMTQAQTSASAYNIPAAAKKANWALLWNDEFTDSSTLSSNYDYPYLVNSDRMNSANKQGYDAVSQREIWGDNTATISSSGTCKVGVWTESSTRHRTTRLQTKKGFPYGYFETRARFGGAQGAHTAFWTTGGSWVASSCSFVPGPLENVPGGIEMDVIEHRAMAQDKTDISNYARPAVHWNDYGSCHQSRGRVPELYQQGDPSTFRTYGLLHTPTDGIIMYIDGVQYWSFSAHTYIAQKILLSAEIYVTPATGSPVPNWAGPNTLSSYGGSTSPAAYIEADYIRFFGDQDFATFVAPYTNGICAFNCLTSLLEKFRQAGKIISYDSPNYLMQTYGTASQYGLQIQTWEQFNLIFHERIADWRAGKCVSWPAADSKQFQSSLTCSGGMTANKKTFLSAFTGDWLDVPKLNTFLSNAVSQGLFKGYDAAGTVMYYYGTSSGSYQYVMTSDTLSSIWDQCVIGYWDQGLPKLGATSQFVSTGNKVELAAPATPSPTKTSTKTTTTTTTNTTRSPTPSPTPLTNREKFVKMFTGAWMDVPKLDTFLRTAANSGLFKGYDAAGMVMNAYGTISGGYTYILSTDQIGKIWDDCVVNYWAKGLPKLGTAAQFVLIGTPTTTTKTTTTKSPTPSPTLTARAKFLKMYTGAWMDVPKLDTFLRTAAQSGLFHGYDPAGMVMNAYGINSGGYRYITSTTQLGKIWDECAALYWVNRLPKLGTIGVFVYIS